MVPSIVLLPKLAVRARSHIAPVVARRHVRPIGACIGSVGVGRRPARQPFRPNPVYRMAFVLFWVGRIRPPSVRVEIGVPGGRAIVSRRVVEGS